MGLWTYQKLISDEILSSGDPWMFARLWCGCTQVNEWLSLYCTGKGFSALVFKVGLYLADAKQAQTGRFRTQVQVK